MNAYLSYWKPARVAWDKPGSQLIDHISSDQFHKVLPGDHVYLMTWHEKKFWLVGRIVVEAVVNQLEAATRLKCQPDELWDAGYHLIAVPGTEIKVSPVEFGDVLPKLFTFSSGKTCSIETPITPFRFQTMRFFTPGSAELLQDLIKVP